MFALTILGSNSAIPTYGRNPTAQILQTQNDSFLIDCGEGTQLQIAKYKIKLSKLSHIFISHLHGDHYFGLIGLISSMSLLNRTQPLHIYGPALLKDIIDIQLKAADVILSYELNFFAIEKEGILTKTSKISIEAFKVNHRIETYGFVFSEIKKPRSILSDKTIEHNIPAAYYEQLQNGENYIDKNGITIPNELLTTQAPKGKKYVYCADTLFDTSIVEFIQDADLLYHETTYLKDQEEKAKNRFHSTTVQAGNIAKLSNAKQLIIGHYSSKYETTHDFLVETKEVFSNTVLAIEGCCYKI